MFFCGDTHGEMNYVKWLIDQRNIRNTDIIHVGDFGVGLHVNKTATDHKNKAFNDWLAERGLVMHVFRGNHDDPRYFMGNHIFDNLKFHTDYTILEIEGKRILGVGGAISIDRLQRTFENEQALKYKTGIEYHWDGVEFNYMDGILDKIEGTDILVTHTTPGFLPPVNKNGQWPEIIKHFAKHDQTLIQDLIEEREILTKFFNHFKKKNDIKHHFYGHFHYHHMTILGDCTHICLDINQLYELKDYRGYEDDLNKKYGE
jgi:hypothetical protein